jgi:signal transduction histidine kinase
MTPLEGPVRGRIDGEGRLVRADLALVGLQERAGGEMGGPLAIPQLAALARLVRRIGVPVARTVLAADGEEDLDLWVRGRLDGEEVVLAIAGWTRRPMHPPLERGAQAALTYDTLRAEGDWTWETDAALRLVALSTEGVRAFGGDSGLPAVGDALTRLVTLEDGEEGGPPLLAALADGQAFLNQIVTVRSGGTRFRLAGVPRLDPSGRVMGFRGAGFTIAEEATEAPAEEVDGAFSVRLDAALRTPLQRIVSAAEAIRAQEDGPLRSDYGGYAGDIATAGRHLLGLVDDLVDLDQVERADLAVEAERLDLTDLARRAAGLLSVRADDKGMAIERPDEDAAKLTVRADFGRALQVLVNLVGNAVRYGPDGSTVTVTVEPRGDHAAAIVVDQGRGIAPEHHEKVFEKFERLGATEPGSGLGLYISRRLARAMGGDIAIESGEGEGARFAFTLPLA